MPAYEEIAARLRGQIADGTLAPGQRLPAEGALAAGFGVSRSTVREALRVLGSEGLVCTRRGVKGGSFVTESEPKALSGYLETRLGILRTQEEISSDELLETLGLLAPAAASLAAKRRTATHLEAMRGALEDGGDFHAELLSATQNGLLELIAAPMVELVADGLRKRARGDACTGLSKDQGRILERIEAGDAEGASAAMAAHLARLDRA